MFSIQGEVGVELKVTIEDPCTLQEMGITDDATIMADV